MSRWVWAVLAACALAFSAGAQKKPEPKPKEPSKHEEEQAPPEEDESSKVKEYSFNPLQAANEVRIGNYYFKKGSYRAAVQRFREATHWNPGFAEAWLRLAEAAEKQKDPKSAREAYAKFLELSPDAKSAAEIKKKLEKLR